MNTTRLESSYGFITIETPTGRIINADIDDSSSYIHEIKRFDIAEFNDWFFRRYGVQPQLEELDILELGFWTKNGVYHTASDWRYTIREELEKEGKLIVYN